MLLMRNLKKLSWTEVYKSIVSKWPCRQRHNRNKQQHKNSQQNKFRGKRLGIFAQQSTTFSLEGVVKLAHWHGSFEGRFGIIRQSGQKCEIWQRSVGNLVSRIRVVRPGSVGLIGRLSGCVPPMLKLWHLSDKHTYYIYNLPHYWSKP